MSFHIDRFVKKAKKKHTCAWCSALIKPGDSYYKSCGNQSGFYSYPLCSRCFYVMNNFFYEIFGENSIDDIGDFYECVALNFGLFNCPSYCSSRSGDVQDLSDDGLNATMYCDECGKEWTVDLSYDAISNVIKDCSSMRKINWENY